ncbi:MAG: NAD(P)/FAD-dependent oxidoreductase [Pseudomonadota bacterium]
MARPENSIDVAIIGAGLSGLATALLLQEAGKSFCILEAREHPGGRIRSVFDKDGRFLADLGPSWIWPAFQPVISRWVDKLELSAFSQYDNGKAILDYGPDQPAKATFIPGQEGNMRVMGGSQALVGALVSRLSKETIRTGSAVQTINLKNDRLLIKTVSGETVEANQIVVAIPPRIALKTIHWQPELPENLKQSLGMTPTWMAPHAKVAVVYETAFWREAGLSGRIASRTGPVVETHDHCAEDGSIAALWGFIGWPHDVRTELGDALKTNVQAQLKRCFGPDSPEPVSIHIEKWSQDPFVASATDLSGPMHHPTVGPAALRDVYFENRICFAGSETAERSPGLIEGAFDAAERAAATVLKFGADNQTEPAV